jgi:hypothetical protein
LRVDFLEKKWGELIILFKINNNIIKCYLKWHKCDWKYYVIVYYGDGKIRSSYSTSILSTCWGSCSASCWACEDDWATLHNLSFPYHASGQKRLLHALYVRNHVLHSAYPVFLSQHCWPFLKNKENNINFIHAFCETLGAQKQQWNS